MMSFDAMPAILPVKPAGLSSTNVPAAEPENVAAWAEAPNSSTTDAPEIVTGDGAVVAAVVELTATPKLAPAAEKDTGAFVPRSSMAALDGNSMPITDSEAALWVFATV